MQTQIADAVHGMVYLSEFESAIVNTRAFQRLRGVKHVGLASQVFPGADYSRFAHGIGTMHITGLILNSLARCNHGAVTDHDIRLYRAAALLHDIGHYPFSHTFERALNDYYGQADPRRTPWLHEELGRHVILEDAALRRLLDFYDLDAHMVAQIIEDNDPPKYGSLVSSGIDADRIDYLMRSAAHIGLPYGSIDVEYLLSQIRLDRDQRICFSPKGMRAAEHLLLCRYFDYQQISFHKTVAGLELVFNDAIGALLRAGALHCAPEDLYAMIRDGRWYSFDDASIIEVMRNARDDPRYSESDGLVFASVLDRSPPKLIIQRERLGLTTDHRCTLQALVGTAHEKLPEWEAKFGARFYVWKQEEIKLTNSASKVSTPAIRILASEQTSRPIYECGNSLMSILNAHALYSVRIYALFSNAIEPDLSTIRSQVDTDLGSAWRTMFD